MNGDTLYGKEDVRYLLLALADAHPGWRNPKIVDPSSGEEHPRMVCVYQTASEVPATRPERPGRIHRCAVGQMAYEMGWELPGPEVLVGAAAAAEACAWPVDENGAMELSIMQSWFDGTSADPNAPAPYWGDVARDLRRAFADDAEAGL